MWETTRDIVLVSNLIMQFKKGVDKAYSPLDQKTRIVLFGRMRKIIQRTERSFRIFKALSKTHSG